MISSGMNPRREDLLHSGYCELALLSHYFHAAEILLTDLTQASSHIPTMVPTKSRPFPRGYLRLASRNYYARRQGSGSSLEPPMTIATMKNGSHRRVHLANQPWRHIQERQLPHLTG